MLTFPIDAVPVSGKFESSYTSQTTLKELLMSSLHLLKINHHGRTKCYKDFRE
jgi:hypothetical protein